MTIDCCQFCDRYNCAYYAQTMTKPNDVSRTELLQKALLEYLAHGSENDPSLVVSVCAAAIVCRLQSVWYFSIAFRNEECFS